MTNDLSNLLPPERRQALAHEYFLRLGVIVVWFMVALTSIATVLLIPTYVFLSENVHTKQAHLSAIESSFSTTGGSSFSARLLELSNNTETLAALAQTPSVSMLIRAELVLSRPGISLSGFAYTPAAGTKRGILTVSGIAQTRDALRSYQMALSSASFAQSANLPVSAYAKDSHIPFTITITLAP
ncbi:MAG: hypothetical protein NT108_02505 [Candidatus Kaiserbacteria bacterium]|nr:hypothetical protein [Candidatus Kaiserbacteria bacterium]